MKILILRKQLLAEPRSAARSPMAVDRLQLPRDAVAWLALRERSFREETPPVGVWTVRDVLRELGDGARTRRITWMAKPARADATGRASLCGAVSVSAAWQQSEVARLHWLMVDPDWQRRGVGSQLLVTAERYCWDQGWHEIRLETHAGWAAATSFYKQHGYVANLTCLKSEMG